LKNAVVVAATAAAAGIIIIIIVTDSSEAWSSLRACVQWPRHHRTHCKTKKKKT